MVVAVVALALTLAGVAGALAFGCRALIGEVRRSASLIVELGDANRLHARAAADLRIANEMLERTRREYAALQDSVQGMRSKLLEQVPSAYLLSEFDRLFGLRAEEADPAPGGDDAGVRDQTTAHEAPDPEDGVLR